jgi:hypothetical protein
MSSFRPTFALAPLKYLATILLLSVPVPAAADSIIWTASGTWTFVHDPQAYWPGLQVGTPWSLALTFDPATPGQLVNASTPHCYRYATGEAALTIGGFSYSNSSGSVSTNFQFPEVGCTENTLPNEPGLVTFLFPDPWVQEQGAWDLNGPPTGGSFLSISYYDLLAIDGTLPTVPTINPNLFVYDGMVLNLFSPQQSQLFSEIAPSAVPEPATLTMFGLGLASLMVRRMRTKVR